MQHRAYSLLTVKSTDDELRLIDGIASTPSTDRVGDIVEPSGAKFESSIPLLLHHDSRLPVGTARLKKTDDGITFQARLPKIDEPGTLKTRVDEAWHSLKAGLIRGVSIGFRSFDDGVELMKGGGLRFTGFEVLELSLVSVPANQDASVSVIRSLDQSYLAASGHGTTTQHVQRPGVSGTPTVISRLERPVKTITEQISAFEASRQAKSARMEELQNKASGEGRTKDEAEKQEFDGLKSELKAIDAELVDLRDMETSNKAAAKPVHAETIAKASESRQPSFVQVKDNVPPAMGMTRLVIAKLASRMEGFSALEVAKARWPNHTAVHQALIAKATVPAALTTTSTWAGNLVYAQNLESEFLDYLRPMTIVGRIPGLRRVPFNVRIAGQTTGSVANWVGQGKPKPVTSFSTNAQSLGFTKIAAIAVLTEESVRFSSPSLENLVRDELARAVIERKDVDFIDPAHTLVANVNPASITNGVTPLASAGSSADNVRTDLTNLLGDFLNANLKLGGLVLVMPETLALALSIMTNALGQPEFPTMGISGGTLLGIPVVTSQYAANQSGAGNLVIAINAGDVAIAEDDNVRVDASGDASIQMSDAPTNDASTGTGQSLVSMYQTNSIAVRAEQYVNWAKLRSSAVVYMDDVNWGSVGSPS